MNSAVVRRQSYVVREKPTTEDAEEHRGTPQRSFGIGHAEPQHPRDSLW